MLRLRCTLLLFFFATVPLVGSAQTKKRLDHIVVYKDGFYLKGRVGEKVGEVIYDSKSGMSFPILAGEFFLDDGVRTIYFSHNQIQRAIPLESNVSKPIKRFDRITQDREILSQFVFDRYSPWSEDGERIVHVDNSKGRGGAFNITQRVGLLTPQAIKAFTIHYAWNLAYFPQEFGPELTRSIIMKIFSERKEYKAMTPAQRFLLLATFMQEAGWYDQAERELTDTMNNYPSEKKLIQERLANLKQVRANLYVENIQQASNVGQHQAAIDRLQAFERNGWDKDASQKHQLIASDLKTDYEKAKTRIAEVKRYLKILPADTKRAATWSKACAFIADELNFDTIGLQKGRLDAFLDFAKQYELDLKNQRKPSQSAEQVLALAASGWLQGNQAAEPDAKTALMLLRAREFIIEYLRTDFAPKRATLLSEFRQENPLPVDVMARLLRMIPPSHALEPERINTTVTTMPIEAPESAGGSYLVQLPPEYHHLRVYPVLMLFHSGRDKPDEMLKRFSAEAAKRGFILVAPLWAGEQPLKAKYLYRDRDHQLVLDTLRDLRRRFQIDSDRVFMFGWEDGANLVYDVGLSHPDQFAGLIPMNGVMQPFTRRFYWPNAQYLPVYLIDGDRNGNSPKINRDLMKDWTRNPYKFTFVEYRGRSSEWFGAEVAHAMSWMAPKKRHLSMKELGRASTTSSQLGEEFRSSRPFDNHYYWLSGDGFLDRNQRDHAGKFSAYFRPATFQANLAVGNLLVKGEAKTWYQVNIRANGMKQTTLWITPSMMELPNLLTVRYNGTLPRGWDKRLVEPNLDVMLEELYRAGDRQRLYFAKFDFRVQ